MKICKDKCIYYVAMSTVLAAGALVLYMAYLLLAPQTIMWQREPIRVEPKIVKAGGYVTLYFDYCKYKELVGNVSIYLIDSQIFSLRTVTSALPVGCRSDLKYPIQIPATVEPGVYHIRETLDFHLNPLREIHYSYDSEDFTIIK